MNNSYTLILALTSRMCLVAGQLITIWCYASAFNITELSVYNAAATIALIFATLLFHPFDTALQKRYTKRIKNKLDLSTIKIWYLILLSTCILSLIFSTALNNYHYANLLLMSFILCISSYTAHSSKTLYLNSGQVLIYNLLIITETLFKIVPLLTFYVNQLLDLNSFILITVASQSISSVFLIFNKRSKFKITRLKIIALSFNKSYLQRAYGNTFHWIITNTFRILLILSAQDNLIAMGLTCYALGCAASQSMNSVINQIFYPKIYAHNYNVFFNFCIIIFLSNITLGALLFVALLVLSDWVFPSHFVGYEIFIFAGLLTEMLNGMLGPVSIISNFKNKDSYLRKCYSVGAFLALIFCIICSLLQFWELTFILPACCLSVVLFLCHKAIINEQ